MHKDFGATLYMLFAALYEIYQLWTLSRLIYIPNPLPIFFQTYIGSIVASVNPYKAIPGLYDYTTVEQYSRHHLGEIPPHIFAVANECYRCLWKRHDNQCVLIRYLNTVLITPDFAAEI